MANLILCTCVFRIALPLLLATCVVFRPSLLSALYLILLLYAPLVPIPTTQTMSGHTGIFLKLLLLITTVTTILQLSFQVVLLGLKPYGGFLKKCEYLEKVLRYSGFVRLDNVDAVAITTWITPEIIMFLSSIVIYYFCYKLTAANSEFSGEEGIEVRAKTKTHKNYGFWNTLGKYLALASLCFAATLRPSVQGGLYFIIFLSSATWWACYKELQKGFAIILRCLMVVVFLHIGTLYTYQFPFFQQVLEPNSTYARYFGLTAIMTVNCDEPRNFYWMDLEWASYVNPIALLWLYYVLALVSKQVLKPKLIHGVSSSRRYYSGSKRGASILQDSTGSVTVARETTEDIPMNSLVSDDEVDKPSCFDNLLFALEAILQFIIQSSYVVTNIIMMTWSITYHSWLTFILLLWANVLWMIPNQRRSMLKTSPFLVFYAWFLLISAYIYSMDLTEEELPSTIKDINLAQIGFQKITVLPCNPLLVKCLYTVMFWITLRQYMQERHEAKQSSALADMVAPLHVTVGTATGLNKEKENENLVLKKIGEVFRSFLTKFWIWIVAITLFAVAITGERMTGFRILYMALFLFFILSFQMSFRMWRKVMFGFWLTVIIYSMIILIMVYTYQFDHFPEYWTTYLRVPYEQQLDIGLERYETKQLFVRLVTPTFFVIIAVIQLHYFHKDFMELSTPSEPTLINPTSEDASSAQGRVLEPRSDDTDKTDVSSSLRIDLTDIGNVSSIHLKHTFSTYLKKIQIIVNLIFLFLEIHMLKFVLLMAMFLCIFDKCALYFIIVIFFVLGTTIGRRMQLFVIYACSVYVSLLLLAKMVYQIQYIQHENWNVTCEYNETKNVTENNSEWLGFRKTINGSELPHLVRWNIAYILAVTLYSVIIIRQHNYRTSRGQPPGRVFFMFPNIKHSDADKDIINCLKYLANYGYYKFGVEICFMATVALIGFRLDFYAILYAFWLCILFCMNRHTLARIWNFYMFFIAIFIPIQYIMVIGLPPSLCIDFPWDDSDLLRRIQEWAYLMDNNYPPSSKKLLCDVILLLLVSRQSVVFRIENRYKNEDYPGGSNESIIHLVEQKDFVNPVPDFITYARSYLDIIKRGFLLGFMWITLAIVFLAGTNRVNLFSLGYLIGTFIFLWQGSDIYLKPIPKILRGWNLLLGYNISVITMKAVFQLVGCVFIKEVQLNACWLVQLLGIGCVKKFGNVVHAAGIEDPQECTVPREYIGLAWDGVCFGFLLIQRRIFNSYNFFHIIDETKATTILASRGAELIELLRHKKMHEQEEQERRILEKIKAKMDRIKATQQKLQGPSYKTITDHYVDGLYPNSRPMFRRRQPRSYKEAVRSGDYYMFDELEDDDDLEMIEELQPQDEDELEEEGAAKRSMPKRRTIGQLLSTAMKTDIGTTLRMSDSEAKRRASMPLARQRSTVSTRSQLSAPPITGKRRHLEHVVISESKEPLEPKPGTSKDDEELSDLTEPKESKCQKFVDFMLFTWAFIESLMISIINYLNKYSKDYRYVIKVLIKEKKLLKETTDYSVGVRLGRNQTWQPAGSYQNLMSKSRPGNYTIPQYEEYEAAELSSYDQPTIVRLLLAIWYIILCHSDVLCYFVIFLNQIKSATFLSLTLPILVFLWGTLTIPRPTKTFWVSIIAYTQLIVVIKCLFQFEIFPWNQSTAVVTPFYPPKIIGIERNKNYAIWDLLLLLIVFFHRYLLKCLGLWKTTLITPAVLSDGEYRVEIDDTDGKKKDKNLLTKNVKNSPTSRKGSDLQRLVEESEGVTDEERVEENTHEISKDRDNKVVTIKTEQIEPYEMFPDTLNMTSSKYAEAIKLCFEQLLDPTSRVAADVYSYMFLCDFFNFFVILMGYSSFGTQQGDGGVSSYLEDNRVPTMFLLMLILQFMLIVIDRAIFLRKNILAKIIFQFLQIIILHIWLFVVFPIMTERNFNSVLPPQMYYMVKCFYLLLSAYQIRCGYPSRILGNFLCKGYNYVNMFLFKGFMIIPFLFELRTVMDWMWTDTSMTVFDWIKMEDIFAHIFQLKCTRHVENEYPQPRGERKSPTIKYIMGGGLLFIIIAIIWFPLVFFSLGNAVGEPNVPYDVTLDIRIGPYEPVYQLSAQSNSVFSFHSQDMKKLNQAYVKNKVATTFISNYEAPDIAAVKLSGDSASVWSISPPDRERMIEEVNSTKPITVHLQYQVSHKSTSKEDPGVIREEIIVTLDAEINGAPNPDRQNLLLMLDGEKAHPVSLGYILPKFIKVTNRGTAKSVTQLMDEYPVVESSSRIMLNLVLSHSDVGLKQEWWQIEENCTDYNYKKYLKNIPYADCNSIMLYTFNDRLFPATLNIITAGGIIGLYTTLVFVASRIARGFFSEICFKIMFDDMPNVDRVLQLCHDIYLVREAREFCLEEDLFAKLVFLYRSPETLIKWTRPKEEVEDDDNPEGEPE